MDDKKIVHISTYYIGNRLYSFLFKKLEDEFLQEIYIPIRSNEHYGKNKLDINNANYHYHNTLSLITKISLNMKVYFQYKYLTRLNINNDTVIHAHSLISDGSTAYKINRKKGVKYIVAVRNTDVNVFLKKIPYLRRRAYRTLEKSQKIILINFFTKSNLADIYGMKKMDMIEKKIEIIPNGIPAHYINSSILKKEVPKNIIEFVYIGEFTKNKNLHSVLEFIRNAKLNNLNYHLNVIGKGKEENLLKQLTRDFNIVEEVTFYGHFNEWEQIKKVLDCSNIFIMTSLQETFGVVYLEALARGLPIIYTNGTGISGYFSEGLVGHGVDPLNIEEYLIVTKKILQNYEQYSINCLNVIRNFTWDSIADRYKTIYLDI